MFSDVFDGYLRRDRDTLSLKLLSSTHFCGPLAVSIPVCVHSCLWPFCFAAFQVCGLSVCGPFGLCPFRFVAVMTGSEMHEHVTEIWHLFRPKNLFHWIPSCSFSINIHRGIPKGVGISMNEITTIWLSFYTTDGLNNLPFTKYAHFR